MLAYNSSSFFGRTRRGGAGRAHGQPHAHAHAHAHGQHAQLAHHAAPPVAAYAPMPIKNLPITDETEGEDAVMMSNDPISAHLADNPADNISLVFKTGRSYRVSNTRRSDFTRHGEGLYRFECGGANPSNHRLASLQRVGLSIGGGFIDFTRCGGFRDDIQVYYLKPVRVVDRTGSVPNSGYCQPDTGGQVFDMYPARLLAQADVVDVGFGRSRANRRRSATNSRRR